jgi:hypothetical protein
MAEATAEDKARYETIRKELALALPKKRALDKQLVRISLPIPTYLYSHQVRYRLRSKFKYSISRALT